MSNREIYFDNADPSDDVGQVCFRRFPDGSLQVYTGCDPDSDLPVCTSYGNLSVDDAIQLTHWLIEQISTPKETD